MIRTCSGITQSGLLAAIRFLGAGRIQGGFFLGAAVFYQAADAQEQKHKAQQEHNCARDRVFGDDENANDGEAKNHGRGENAECPPQKPAEPGGGSAAFRSGFSNVKYKFDQKFNQVIHEKVSLWEVFGSTMSRPRTGHPERNGVEGSLRWFEMEGVDGWEILCSG